MPHSNCDPCKDPVGKVGIFLGVVCSIHCTIFLILFVLMTLSAVQVGWHWISWIDNPWIHLGFGGVALIVGWLHHFTVGSWFNQERLLLAFVATSCIIGSVWSEMTLCVHDCETESTFHSHSYNGHIVSHLVFMTGNLIFLFLHRNVLKNRN